MGRGRGTTEPITLSLDWAVRPVICRPLSTMTNYERETGHSENRNHMVAVVSRQRKFLYTHLLSLFFWTIDFLIMEKKRILKLLK